jgi:hypothetical protein
MGDRLDATVSDFLLEIRSTVELSRRLHALIPAASIAVNHYFLGYGCKLWHNYDLVNHIQKFRMWQPGYSNLENVRLSTCYLGDSGSHR